MRIVEGSTRFVLLFPGLGMVIKIPKFWWKWFFKSLVEDYKEGGWNEVKEGFREPLEQHYSYSWCVLGGIRANWREFWLYAWTKHPFLQPTYFSLLGLVNIQKYAPPCPVSNDVIWMQMLRLTNEMVLSDGHHFSDRHNFSLVEGRLRIIDYGSKKSEEVVREYGDVIVCGFDPTLTSEELL